MFRSALGKVAWVGRTASMVFGLALVLALMVGVASTAWSATGGNFILGKWNAATTLTKLTGNVNGAAMQVANSNAGADDTALNLSVQAGEAPMKVNSSARVANLNAARAGRADSAASADAATSAQNADKLDGKDSSVFATKTSEGWHQISASGTTPFDRFYGGWSNYDSQHSTAAYYKDSQGIVHLKGVVKGGSFYSCCYNTEQGMIFLLPQGYWPSEHRVFTAVSGSNTVGRIDVGDGACLATENIPSGTCGAAVQAVGGSSGWITLDGISFRAER